MGGANSKDTPQKATCHRRGNSMDFPPEFGAVLAVVGSTDTNPSPVDPRDRRIVLLGKTGAGKSSAGNTIFGGEKVFHTSTLQSVTDPCKSESRTIHGRKITLIDTTGFFDTRITKNDTKNKIVDFLKESNEGIHAFLIVVPVQTFTEANKICKEIPKVFSDEVFKYATVLFTHGDNLGGKTIQDFVKESDGRERRELVQKCGDRCHVIDNKHWNKRWPLNSKNKVQVKELLKTIDQMVEENGGNCYTNELLQYVQKEIEEEKMLISNSGSKLSESLTGSCVWMYSSYSNSKNCSSRRRSSSSGRSSSSRLGVAGAVLGVEAVVGVGGRVIGYEALDTAETAGEAARAAAKAVCDKVPNEVKDLIQKQIKDINLS